jgi:hypothetical protein
MKSPIVAPNASSAVDISAGVQNFFDGSAYPFVSTYLKPIILAVDFSSLEGSGSDCKSKANSCESIIKNGYSTEQVDLDEQMYIYDAILSEVLQQEWILGVVSMGYNPSVAILDGSSSVRGKPAGEVLRHYFSNVIQD